jgi:glycosyltransferase involved in cell wall biosynthesis
VCSGNLGVSPIVSAQAKSLADSGIDVEIFQIIGKGLSGYVSALPKLRKFCRAKDPDVVHAHYSLCGIVAVIAASQPVITSLMGSDIRQSGIMRILIKFFVNHVWKKTIVKSDAMKAVLRSDKVCVLPNGVDLELFKPMQKEQCQAELHWDTEEKHALFVSAADANRGEKNLRLAEAALRLSSPNNIKLHVVSRLPHSDMPAYLNASDFLLLTSKWEGSPNVVKEAMACNVPVVATEVGDVRWLFGEEPGFWITAQSENEIAKQIDACVLYNARNNGRGRIISLGLSASSIAGKLRDLYEDSITR